MGLISMNELSDNIISKVPLSLPVNNVSIKNDFKQFASMASNLTLQSNAL